MPKKSKKPPSRERYEREHPTISVRVSKELKDVLEDIQGKTGDSYAELIKKGLTNVEKAWEEATEEMYYKGWNDAESEYGVYYYCSRCGKKIFITPGGKSHQAVIECLKGWRHSECP